MVKIPSLPASETLALDELASVLKDLLDAAESGKWEQIEALEVAFRAAAEAVQEMPPSVRHTAAYRNRVGELLAMHNVAINLCKDRMEQIAPLIKAFAGINRPSGKS